MSLPHGWQRTTYRIGKVRTTGCSGPYFLTTAGGWPSLHGNELSIFGTLGQTKHLGRSRYGGSLAGCTFHPMWRDWRSTWERLCTSFRWKHSNCSSNGGSKTPTKSLDPVSLGRP